MDSAGKTQFHGWARDNKPGGRWRGRAPHLWDGHYTRGGMLKHKCCWCWFVKLFTLTCSVSTRQVLETHGHKRSSSWGRTYSFSSAISRGCLTEEQNLDVKAGIQPTLQVLTHTHTHTHTHVVFYGLRGLSIGVMVFILYKLYVLLPYTYPTPKLSPHRRRCISTFPPKNAHFDDL